jgi:sigma-B regulation protein RsbU (phosphoserine phosphatase)
VVISFTLIIFGLLALYWSIGPSLMPLVIAGALVLAAVNLLAWVVSLERGEKESLQTELKIAHDVQVALMPTEQPRVPGFDVAGMSLPAKEVGGDHFDFACLNTDKSKLAISVFDVSGKGMEAAMSAVFTSGAFASEIRECLSPAMLLTNLNRSVFTHRKRGHFVAFMLTVIDTATKSITYANAGQTHPLLLSDGSLQWLSPEGVHFPLGMQEQTVEAMNTQGELFTSERLEQVVRSMDAKNLKAEEILHFVTQQVQAFVGNAPQHDDMTMVVVKVIE